MKSARVWGLCLVILAAVVYRLLPLPLTLVNFSPIGAMALFAGFSFRDKIWAFLFPICALFLSDLFLGFHDTMWAVYLSFAATTALGLFLRDRGDGPMPASFLQKVAIKASGAIASSILFFVVTNFAMWAQSGFYERTPAGLVTCYIAALPFFDNALVGDLFFTGVLFGSWALAETRYPILRGAVSQ